MMWRRLSKKLFYFQLSCYSSDPHPLQNIKIPNKIYRNDLTVLNALASCVDIEAYSSQFGIVNEPWLSPIDYMSRKRMLLSKASGKLSARIAFDGIKHDFIRVAHDEPKIKCLLPLLSVEDIKQKVIDGKISQDKALFLIINLLNSKESWKFYEENRSYSFSSDVIESLLDLLCATGCEETMLNMLPEEIYFTKLNINENYNQIKWRPDNEAETLFLELISIGKATRHCFESMIRGSSKFQDPVRALELYREMNARYPNYHPGLKTCNSLLRSFKNLIMPKEELKDLIIEILNGLNSHRILPNILTFNNAIFALKNQADTEFVEMLYQEMIALEIEPIFGTFAVILECQFSKSYLINLVQEVIEILESYSHKHDRYTIQSPDDFSLFNTCITVLRSTEMWELALRLHKLVMSGRYFHLLATDKSKAHYCDNFIKLLTLRCPDFDHIISSIKVLVPKFYILQPSTIESLLHKLTKAQRFDLLPDLFSVINWNSTIVMELDAFTKILKVLLSVDYLVNEKLKEAMGNQMEKILEISRIRKESIFEKPANMDLAIELTIHLDRPKVLWDLIDRAANKNQSLYNSTLVLKLLQHFFVQQDQLEKIPDLIELFVKCLAANKKMMIDHGIENAGGQTPIDKIVEFGMQKVIPELDRLCISVTEFKSHLKNLEQIQSSLSDDNSSSDSSDDDDSDLD